MGAFLNNNKLPKPILNGAKVNAYVNNQKIWKGAVIPLIEYPIRYVVCLKDDQTVIDNWKNTHLGTWREFREVSATQNYSPLYLCHAPTTQATVINRTANTVTLTAANCNHEHYYGEGNVTPGTGEGNLIVPVAGASGDYSGVSIAQTGSNLVGHNNLPLSHAVRMFYRVS